MDRRVATRHILTTDFFCRGKGEGGPGGRGTGDGRTDGGGESGYPLRISPGTHFSVLLSSAILSVYNVICVLSVPAMWFIYITLTPHNALPSLRHYFLFMFIARHCLRVPFCCSHALPALPLPAFPASPRVPATISSTIPGNTATRQRCCRLARHCCSRA